MNKCMSVCGLMGVRQTPRSIPAGDADVSPKRAFLTITIVWGADGWGEGKRTRARPVVGCGLPTDRRRARAGPELETKARALCASGSRHTTAGADSASAMDGRLSFPRVCPRGCHNHGATPHGSGQRSRSVRNRESSAVAHGGG